MSRGMQTAKLDRWAILLQEYDIKLIHIKGKDNILADAISRLHTIDIYEDPTEVKLKLSPVPESQPGSSKTTYEMQLVDARTPQELLIITTKTLEGCKNRIHSAKRKFMK